MLLVCKYPQCNRQSVISFKHGFSGGSEEVCHHLLHLNDMAQNTRAAFWELDHNFNSSRSQLLLHQVKRIRHHFSRIDECWSLGRPAPKHPHVVNDCSCTCALICNALQFISPVICSDRRLHSLTFPCASTMKVGTLAA